MSNWNKRKDKLFIPDQETPKTYICKVCGSKIIPRKSKRYTVRDRVYTGGVSNAISGSSTEPELYDAYDCDVCGCQIRLNERFKDAN